MGWNGTGPPQTLRWSPIAHAWTASRSALRDHRHWDSGTVGAGCVVRPVAEFAAGSVPPTVDLAGSAVGAGAVAIAGEAAPRHPGCPFRPPPWRLPGRRSCNCQWCRTSRCRAGRTSHTPSSRPTPCGQGSVRPVLATSIEFARAEMGHRSRQGTAHSHLGWLDRRRADESDGRGISG
jgi:hypothetical protein